MTYGSGGQQGVEGLPGWVPAYAMQYLEHTEKGISIRALARKSQCHASTVLRQIRRVEARRDDPLIDAALANLGTYVAPCGEPQQSAAHALIHSERGDLPSEHEFLEAAQSVLVELCHLGAILAVADGMDKAVVVRDDPARETGGQTVVDRKIAEAMALKDWITCQSSGRIARYQVTPDGRAALRKLLAAQENSRQGFGEVASEFKFKGKEDSKSGRIRFHTAESPLVLLSRRKDRDGNPFLSADLVRAGNRLREDFELAQLDASRTTTETAASIEALEDSDPASLRVAQAIDALGEGLSDIAIRCCCFLEGIERTEQRLGWPARSGKVVLRIALVRLSEHYRQTHAELGDLIG